MKYIRSLALVLVASSLLFTSAQAEWLSYKDSVTITAPQQPAVDRVNRAYFVYVDIDNSSGLDIPAGTRLVVKNSSLPVTNSLSPVASAYYFDLPAIAHGGKYTQKVMFQLSRVALSYEVDLELDTANPIIPDCTIGTSKIGSCKL